MYKLHCACTRRRRPINYFLKPYKRDEKYIIKRRNWFLYFYNYSSRLEIIQPIFDFQSRSCSVRLEIIGTFFDCDSWWCFKHFKTFLGHTVSNFAAKIWLSGGFSFCPRLVIISNLFRIVHTT